MSTFGSLIQDATDRAVEYGVLAKTEEIFTAPQIVMKLVPIALWPSVFPKKHYDFLLQVQMDYNILVDKLGGNNILLMDSLQRLVGDNLSDN